MGILCSYAKGTILFILLIQKFKKKKNTKQKQKKTRKRESKRKRKKHTSTRVYENLKLVKTLY